MSDIFNALTAVNSILLVYVIIQPSWTILLITATTAVLLVAFLTRKKSPGDLPGKEARYFGKGSKVADDKTITDFTIHVSDDDIADLKQRLTAARFYPALEGSLFNYGFNLDFLKEVRDYWLNKYEWRTHEAHLNQFDHFRTQIEGLMIHFIHAKPPANKYKRVEPLLIVHGWPGSVDEFLKIIPMLTDPVAHGVGDTSLAFDVVAPSIPGFGWSQAPAKKGFGHPDAARIFKTLMERLGYRKFFCQGGDWGSIVVSDLAIAFPNSVIGLHQNMFPVMATFRPGLLLRVLVGTLFPSVAVDKDEYSKAYPLLASLKKKLIETGYLHIQATKPDSLGAGLNDSPIGLAAWILEKFSTATNYAYVDLEDGGLKNGEFTMDELLTNVSIYWFTKTGGTSARFYKEAYSSSSPSAYNSAVVTVPTAAAIFPHEPLNSPRTFIEYRYTDLRRYTRLPRGGHFAAFEQPTLLAHDLLQFAGELVKTLA